MCTGAETVVPAALRGYRTWHHSSDGGLWSRMPYEWGFGEQPAQCLTSRACSCVICSFYNYRRAERPVHSAPDAGCECGFYGWYSPVDSRLQLGSVFGAVEVTGRVLMGTHGFRAERARVLGLVIESATLGAQVLRQRAEVSLVPVFSSRAALLEQLPPDDVSSLVDHSCDQRCVSGAPPWVPPSMAGIPQATAVEAAKWLAALRDPAPEAAVSDEPEPTVSAAERALALRRSRNTGPRERRRFSRFIRPTGGAR